MAKIVARDQRRPMRPAPAGLHSAVCVDVVDLPEQDSPWGPRHQVEFRWQIETINPENDKRYLVVRRFTLSLNEKSNLRPFVESWRGEPYTKDQVAEGVDIEDEFVGRRALLQIMHEETESGVYAKPASAMPLPDVFVKLDPRDYVRAKDRTPSSTTSTTTREEENAGDDTAPSTAPPAPRSAVGGAPSSSQPTPSRPLPSSPAAVPSTDTEGMPPWPQTLDLLKKQCREYLTELRLSDDRAKEIWRIVGTPQGTTDDWKRYFIVLYTMKGGALQGAAVIEALKSVPKEAPVEDVPF